MITNKPNYRTVKEIADVCGVSEATVQRRLKEWKEAGIIPNVYLRKIINNLLIE